MYKSNTALRKLYILCCLTARPLTGERGGGTFEGGLRFLTVFIMSDFGNIQALHVDVYKEFFYMQFPHTF